MCVIISTIIFHYSDTFRGSPQSTLTNGIGHRLVHDHFHPFFFRTSTFTTDSNMRRYAVSMRF